MAKTKSFSELYKALGITSSQQLECFDSIEATARKAELEELVFLQEIAINKSQALARECGLELISSPTNADKGMFSKSWQKYTNEFKMTAQLSSNTPIDSLQSFGYDSRTIETHIQSSISNNDFNPNNVDEIFASIYKAAQDLAPTKNKTKYLQTVKELHLNFTSGVEYTVKGKKNRDGLNAIKMDLTNPKKKLKTVLERCSKLNQFFIGELALALWRADGNEGKPTHSDYAKYVKKIQEQEIHNASQNKRPILINIYKQEVEKPENNTAYYVMVTHKPKSDQSSASRSMTDEEKMFSNNWEVTVEQVKIKRDPENGMTKEVTKYAQYDRSSSIARLSHEENNKEGEEEDLEIVYASFCKLAIQKARDLVISKINNQENLDEILGNNELVLKEAFITLLSPLVSKHKGKKFTSKLGKIITTKTIHENEADQLKSTEYCLERIANETLRFSNKDVQYILDHTKNSNQKIKKSVLETMNIKHRGYYANYMVNKVGPVLSENLDFAKHNWQYFLRGNRYRRSEMVKYIQSIPEEAVSSRRKHLLIKIILNQEKKTIAADLKNFLSVHEEHLNDYNLKGMLNLYIKIENHFLLANSRIFGIKKISRQIYHGTRKILGYKGYVEPFDRAAASYIAANMDAEFARCLGYTNIVFTCKSGVDRTGFLASFVEALSSAADIFKINKALLEKNLLNSLKHGANRTIKCQNLPGIAGLQLPNNAVTSMSSICGFFRNMYLSFIGSMSRRFYMQAKKNTTLNIIIKNPQKNNKKEMADNTNTHIAKKQPDKTMLSSKWTNGRLSKLLSTAKSTAKAANHRFLYQQNKHNYSLTTTKTSDIKTPNTTHYDKMQQELTKRLQELNKPQDQTKGKINPNRTSHKE